MSRRQLARLTARAIIDAVGFALIIAAAAGLVVALEILADVGRTLIS